MEDLEGIQKVVNDSLLDKTLQWLEDISYFFKLPDKETCSKFSPFETN